MTPLLSAGNFWCQYTDVKGITICVIMKLIYRNIPINLKCVHANFHFRRELYDILITHLISCSTSENIEELILWGIIFNLNSATSLTVFNV